MDPTPTPEPPLEAPPPVAPDLWILVAGDVVEGFRFYGPYPTEDATLDAQADYESQVRRPTVVARLHPR